MKKDNKRVFNYDYLRKLIKESSLSVSEIAKKTGISEQTLNKTLNNDRDFYISEIYKIVNILQIDQKQIDRAFFSTSKESE